MILGQRIREERKHLRISQEKLAFKAGISVNFLGQIERGTKKPTLSTADRIASALYLSLNKLLTEGPVYRSSEEKILESSLLYHLKERTYEEKEAFLNFLKSFPSSKGSIKSSKGSK